MQFGWAEIENGGRIQEYQVEKYDESQQAFCYKLSFYPRRKINDCWRKKKIDWLSKKWT